MRGADVQQGGLFSYVSVVESRIPANHPLRALAATSRDFDRVYAEGGRSSVPPERLVRALVLQGAALDRQRAAADGATRLQPAVPLVRGAVD